MQPEPYLPEDREEVLRIRAEVFRGARLEEHLWQPCQQVESLGTDAFKLVVREGPRLVGYGAAYPLDRTHYRLNLLVAESHAGRGVGTLLLSALEEEVRRAGGEYLQARTLEGASSGAGFALARGFREVHRMRGMTLRAADFRFEAFAPLGPKLSAEGFRLTTLKEELDAGRDAATELARLHLAAQEGWPSPDPTWEADARELPVRLFKDLPAPERFSIMKLGAAYVGYTSAARANQSATAVRPAERGRGVATYLKAANLRLCLAAGDEHFETCTASPAMYRVNEKLGYRFNGLSEVRLLKGF